MRFCRGCGGILGRDCFNERECLVAAEYESRGLDEIDLEVEAAYWQAADADYCDAMAYDLWWSLLYAGPRPTRAVTVPDRMEWSA